MSERRRFPKFKAGVLTLSDRASQGIYADESGKTLCERLKKEGCYAVSRYEVIPDEETILRERLLSWSDQDRLDLILTTGGTGLGPRDRTPEATDQVIERNVPGLAERLRFEGGRRTPLAWLSRGRAGVRGQTLIVNLAGSVKAVQEGFDLLRPLLPHALELLRGKPHAIGR